MTLFGVTEERYDELKELVKQAILASASADNFEAVILNNIKELPLNEVFVLGGIYGMILWDFRHDVLKPHIHTIFVGPSAS